MGEELRISQYYAKKNHEHSNATENQSGFMSAEDKRNLATYSIRLSDAVEPTLNTKHYEMVTRTSNRKIYAFVRKNNENVTNGVVIFIVNGITYPKLIKLYDENHYCAVLNINLDTCQDYHIFASYVGEGDLDNHDTYSYCIDYCILSIVDPYIIHADDMEKKQGGNEPFTVTLTDRNNNPLINKDINIRVNGVDYSKTTDNNGVAKLNINLGVGEYNATTTYEYEENNEKYLLKKENKITITPSD